MPYTPRARKPSYKPVFKALEKYVQQVGKLLLRPGIDVEIEFNNALYRFGSCFLPEELEDQARDFRRFISDYLNLRLRACVDLIFSDMPEQEKDAALADLFSLFDGLSNVKNVNHYALKNKAIRLKKEEYLKHAARKSVPLNYSYWCVRQQLGNINDTVVEKTISI